MHPGLLYPQQNGCSWNWARARAAPSGLTLWCSDGTLLQSSLRATGRERSDVLILTCGGHVPLSLKSRKRCPWLQRKQPQHQQNGNGARLSPRASRAVVQVGPSSLCSTTEAPATETTQVTCCFLGAFPARPGSPPLPGPCSRCWLVVRSRSR